MNQFGLNLGNPSNFGDWTKYAGFNPSVPVTGVEGSAQPIAPPSVEQMTDTFSKIGDQIGSGNMYGAYQTYVGKKPVAPSASKISAPQVQPVPQVTGFGHDFEG